MTMILPPGVTLPPVGTNLSDPKWEVTVSISTGTMPNGVATVAAGQWRERNRGQIETIALGGLKGTLSRRPHSDGNEGIWALLIQADERQVEVEVRDRRNEPTLFVALRRHALSVRWEPSKIDAEKAFGATPGPIEGMRLDNGSAGQLFYRPLGKPGSRVQLSLTGGSLPLVGKLDETMCRERLAGQAAKVAAKDATLKDPQPLPTVSGCDVDVDVGAGDRLYLAFIVGPSGGFVLVSGRAPETSYKEWRPRFRAAATGLRSTR